MRRADVTDLNQRGRQQMRDAGRLEGHDIQIGDKAFARGDEIVIGRNDKHLGVINGDRAQVLDLTEEHLDIKTDKGDELRIPRTFIEDGHVDHSYATTAHKAQGATFDKAFVLGSQEAYREWGYTALSRHRDEARYYIAAPKPFINREPQPLDNAEQLKFSLADALENSRRDELAIEYLKRLKPAKRPEIPKLPDLEPDGLVTEEMRNAAHELLEDLDRSPEQGPTPEPPDLADDLGMDFGM
jgi:ATP-dependent exoDNAse (exonuclease V) alpha subunit